MSTSSVLAQFKEPLTNLGFRKRAGAIYTIELDEGVIGWVGLGTSTRYQQPGLVLVSPRVGVRHQGVHKIIADIRGEKFHPYLPPTVSIGLGYVMPDDSYKDWAVSEDPVSHAFVSEAVDAIERYGLSFMREHCGLDRTDSEAERLSANPEYVRPVLKYLLHGPDPALEEIRARASKLGGASDPASQLLREFLSELRRRVLDGTISES
ncbi:hypothetical protein [Nocardioides plantarum]|uniref:Uncharacterized protein n=1 Tax=Nocardioides plantarum TaxID=29299 RepID=A0ABV5K833_9ACTN|nr:hypothetical protein [Nocardioides plantarum]